MWEGVPTAVSDVVRCLLAKRTDTRMPDLDGSFRAGMDNQRIGWDGVLGDKICIAFALSVSRCVGIVIGQPVKSLRG